MAIGVLFVVVPLLAGSDIVFNRIIKSAFSWMNFEGFNSLIEMFNTLFGVLITFMAGFLLIYAFFYASCRVNSNKETEKKDKQYKSLTGIVFTSIIASVYLLYSMIQIRYLFLKAGLPEGISYSEYAHAGFWIAKYNVSHIEQLTCADLEYMMCNLSLDVAPIIAEIDPKEVSSDDGDGCIYYYGNAQENSAEIMMKNYFQEVSQRCGKIGFRQANFSKIRAKQIAGSF